MSLETEFKEKLTDAIQRYVDIHKVNKLKMSEARSTDVLSLTNLLRTQQDPVKLKEDFMVHYKGMEKSIVASIIPLSIVDRSKLRRFLSVVLLNKKYNDLVLSHAYELSQKDVVIEASRAREQQLQSRIDALELDVVNLRSRTTELEAENRLLKETKTQLQGSIVNLQLLLDRHHIPYDKQEFDDREQEELIAEFVHVQKEPKDEKDYDRLIAEFVLVQEELIVEKGKVIKAEDTIRELKESKEQLFNANMRLLSENKKHKERAMPNKAKIASPIIQPINVDQAVNKFKFF
ncbi:MAG TPA: hypothetical protein VHZ76_10125 [Gammaproteobacteria bacterium]|jgi:hypothetical protein|nr:hypothetical protein [Gammaproteobacteria bacterium]